MRSKRGGPAAPAADVGVLLLAAGRGRRLPGRVVKGLRRLGGRPLYRHALDAFLSMPEVREVVLLVPPGAPPRGIPAGPRLRVAVGGSVRAASVRRGLAALSPEVRWVAVHDAARPFVTPALARAVLAAARRDGGAVPALPVADTVKRVRSARVIGTVPRRGLWAAQTPQAFRRDLLARAFARFPRRFRTWTDDACAFEAMGWRVRVVPGERINRKITTPEDWAWARTFFLKRAQGRGRRGR